MVRLPMTLSGAEGCFC